MFIIKTAVFTLVLLLLSACSTNQLMVRASIPLLEGGIVALNHETDMDLAKDAMPANIEMLESMLVLDPDNLQLRMFGAQAYYAYSYSFIEDDDRKRASAFYLRGLVHGEKALLNSGFTKSLRETAYDEVVALTAKLDKNHVPLLFWTASCMGKWIDMNRAEPGIVAQVAKAAVLMERVLQLDETYYYGSAHLFFGVYYGSRPAMMGGDLKKSQYHFDRARAINASQLLITDVLQAQYLERQRLNQTAFHTLLSRVITNPDELPPEFSLMNRVAQKKASLFIKKELEWF